MRVKGFRRGSQKIEPADGEIFNEKRIKMVIFFAKKILRIGYVCGRIVVMEAAGDDVGTRGVESGRSC